MRFFGFLSLSSLVANSATIILLGSSNNNYLTPVVVAAAEPSPPVFKLPPLPYPDTALEPYISQRTLKFHHGKHHAKYVATTNSMIEDTDLANAASLEEIILKAHETSNQGLFNNAAQSWNHAFYWNCMTPNGGGGPPPSSSGSLANKINASFGSYQEFRTQFSTAGNTAFGSGWAWLVLNTSTDKLSVLKTIGADNPMTTPGIVPILCMDVWEHAYYLDYQNLRTSYVDVFLDKLVNWEFVQENFDRAITPGRGAEL